MRADGDIQFAPVEIPPAPPAEPPPPPADSWLSDFFGWLGEILGPVGQFVGAFWPIISWVLIGAAVLLILYAVWRLVDPVRFIGRRPAADEEERQFAPDKTQALQLLDEADRLASEGRFDEATHLLLMRSVGQIAEARPDLIDPSSTAREISALAALPEKARNAFATIADRVERSLFALRRLSAEDWHAARAAYAEFALGYRAVQV